MKHLDKILWPLETCYIGFSPTKKLKQNSEELIYVSSSIMIWIDYVSNNFFFILPP